MSDRVAKDLQLLLNLSKRERRDRDRVWQENLDWFVGKQTMNKPSWKANTVTNYLFSQIMTIIPKLASDIPDFDIRPEVETMKGQADEIARLMKRILIRNDFERRQVEYITNMLLFGVAYYKITWDDSLWQGEGDIRIDVPDSRNIYLEPGKLSLRDANYIFESRNIDKITLYRMYPDKRADIDELFRKPTNRKDEPTSQQGQRAEIGRHASGPGDPVDTSVEAYIFDRVMKSHGDKDSIELVEAWFYDERTLKDVQKEMQKLDGGDKRYITLFGEDDKDPDSPAYPTGRLVTFSGDTVLDDRPNVFPDFPYIDVTNYVIPGAQYSMSELEQVKPLQEQYNIRANQIFDMLNYNIAPLRLYDARAGLEPDEITNRPDQWVSCADVTGVLQLAPPPIQQSIFESLFKLQKDIESIMGVREVTQGSVPGDVRSGFAIEQLQEAAEVRLRLKLSFLKGADLDMAKYVIRMIGIHYRMGTHYRDTFDLTGAIPDVFTITIKSGASLPTSKFAQQQFIQWMFGQKICDELYVVDNSDLPGKADLIERMKPVWEARKAAEASALMAPPEGAAPPPPPQG